MTFAEFKFIEMNYPHCQRQILTRYIIYFAFDPNLNKKRVGLDLSFTQT